MMMTKRVVALTLSAGLVAACGETNECKSLDALLKKHEVHAEEVRRQAELSERLEKPTVEMRKKAEAFLDSVNLDDPEEDVSDILKKRVAAIEGASMKRNTSDTKIAGAGIGRNKQTFWSIEYKAARKDGLKIAWELAKSPPLFWVERIAFLEKAGLWRVELVRATVDRVPNINPKPIPLPKVAGADTVKSEFGFCGAGQKRSAIAKLQKEVAGLQEKAERLSVLLPTKASWQGILLRAERLQKIEEENRKIMKAILGALDKADVKLVGIGSDDPAVVVEALGGPAEKRKIEAAIAERSAELAWDRSKKGSLRFRMPNQLMRENTRGPGAFRPGAPNQPGPPPGKPHPPHKPGTPH